MQYYVAANTYTTQGSTARNWFKRKGSEDVRALRIMLWNLLRDAKSKSLERTSLVECRYTYILYIN